ncbi:MAG: Rnf-Nqr domain containing protein [Thermoplasmata archaeon]
MNNLISIFIGMALINNFILTRFLGLCPFFGVSKKLSSAVSMGMAVILVMAGASAITWILFFRILVPFGVDYMSTVIFILVIASLVQIVEISIRRTNITLYNALGIYLPLITTNCAVLGVTFINARSDFTFVETMVSACGAGVGFTLVLAIMSGIRERLELADVPKSFEGVPVAFLVAMMLGMAFLAFGGMV